MGRAQAHCAQGAELSENEFSCKKLQTRYLRRRRSRCYGGGIKIKGGFLNRGEEDGKQKILVVDDDKHIAELISLYMMKEGYETQEIYDGKEAAAAVGRLFSLI